MSDLKYKTVEELNEIIDYEEFMIAQRDNEIRQARSLNAGSRERIKWAKRYRNHKQGIETET